VLGASGRGHRLALSAGDAADWGAFRPRHFFSTWNRLPLSAPRRIEGWGSGAFVRGGGTIEVTLGEPIVACSVSAAADLPPDARVQFESIEVRP
jgi:hypothetical protein